MSLYWFCGVLSSVLVSFLFVRKWALIAWDTQQQKTTWKPVDELFKSRHVDGSRTGQQRNKETHIFLHKTTWKRIWIIIFLQITSQIVSGFKFLNTSRKKKSNGVTHASDQHRQRNFKKDLYFVWLFHFPCWATLVQRKDGEKANDFFSVIT